MAGLFRFFGGYFVEPLNGGAVLPLKPQRVTWLLLYLAIQDSWVSREELQLLFWGDSLTSAQSLRQVLYRAKQQGLEAAFEATPKGLYFTASSDVKKFLMAFKDQRFAEVCNWYKGDLGFQTTDLEEVPEFAAWLDLERQQLRQRFIEASQKQALSLQVTQPEAAFGVLETAWREDPFNEVLLEQMLQLADQSQLVQRGLDALQFFASKLKSEIGLDLPANLEQWQQRFKQRVFVVPRATAALSVPQPTTPLLGRETELEALQNLDARVITLLGIGGIGKSRLAFEFARLRVTETFFVSLSATQAETQLAPLVAQAMGLQLPGFDAADLELRQALLVMDADICLVLDNVEQVMTSATALLETLLQVPKLQILVTSRQRLNIVGEHVFMLQGLPFPEANAVYLEQFAAVRLVLTAAHRHGAVFANSSQNLEAIAEITRIVQGVPLALELAAAWLRILRPQEVAVELQKNWGLLEETTLQLPLRQAGLKAVFDSTWALMTALQQQVLAALAFFRGGFVFSAAKAVAGADHRTLLQLMDWALLKRLENGRYDLHPLIREYALGNLQNPEVVQNALNTHFVTLSEHSHQLPPDILDEDVENLLLVWHDALQNRVEPTLEVLTRSLFEVLFRLGRFPELQEHIKAALQISQTKRLTSILKTWSIEVHHNLGGVGKLEFVPNQVRLELEAQDLFFELAILHHTIGLKARDVAKYDAALHHFEQSIRYGRMIPYPYWESVVLPNMALVYEKQDNRVAARRILSDLLEFNVVKNDFNSLAGIHNTFGELECREDQWDSAQDHFIKAEKYAQLAKSNKVHAWVLENLGRVALRNQNIVAAFEYFNAALQKFRSAGDILWVARVRCVLADAYQANAQPEEARLERLKGLRIGQELSNASVVWRCLRTWLPSLQLEQPELAKILEKNINNDKVLLQQLPKLIEYLEVPETPLVRV